MNTKICIFCKANKILNQFYLCGNNYSSRCKICFGEYQRHNPNRKLSKKRYFDKNREKINLKQRTNYHNSLEKSREYNRIKANRLRANNREHYRKVSRKANSKRYYKYKDDPNFKITRILRGRFITAVTKQYKKTSVINLLGCSIDEFRLYIESKFLQGMNWNNHGLYKAGGEAKWHIDHIIPCDAFDLTDLEQQKKCFHYTNMQPLWAIDNLRKNKRFFNKSSL